MKHLSTICVIRSWAMIVLIVTMAFAAHALDPNFKLLNQSRDQINLRFDLGNWKLEMQTKDGQKVQVVTSNARQNLFIGEEETLPVYTAMLAIPGGMDVELSTNVTDSDVVQTESIANRSLMDAAKGSNNLYPSQTIIVSEPGQFRDFRVVSINVYPFQYQAISNDLKVMRSANIGLRLVPSRQAPSHPNPTQVSVSYDNIYRALILNYDQSRDLAITEQPVLLIIYPSGGDTAFSDKLAEFVSWKQKKGYIVNSASTATAGTSFNDVKNYLQGQYDNTSTRPDVVLMIGDPQAGLVVPSNSGQYGDFPYTQLDGTDEYGDVQIGRISVETSEQFGIYVNKLIWYESQVPTTSPSFLDRMLLVGDSYYSGISTYYNNYYIREISQAVNPDYSYTEYCGSYGSGMQTAFDNALIQGVGFFNYRGYMNMSGWSPNSSTTLNSNKPNHAVFITCGTGTFYSGDSDSETYIRLGTSSTPAGGITSLGMATLGTHTSINSFLATGTFDGVFNYGMRTMGEASMYSRAYLQNIYGVSDATDAYTFKRYYNLMGDPTAEVFITIPKTLQISCPTTLASGTRNLSVTVTEGGNPVNQAWVNIQQEGNCSVTTATDDSGVAILELPAGLTGTLTITASKHDYKTASQNVSLSAGGLYIGSYIIDDDTNGNSDGNNNQTLNPGETVELYASITNSSNITYSTVSASFTCSSEYISLIQGTVTFPNIAVGSTVTASLPLVFNVANDCPHGQQLMFTAAGSSSNGSWNSNLPLTVSGADLDYISYNLTGADSYLSPGESAGLYTTIANNGTEQISAVYGILRSLSNYVEVNDSLKYFGNLASGSQASNSTNAFIVQAISPAIAGMQIPMELHLYNNTGYLEIVTFILIIGNIAVNQPLGQDGYGYFIFDGGDTDYDHCPVYNWVGIAPAEGGSGTSLAISDVNNTTDEGDQIGSDSGEVITLPFTFRFYGVDYDTLTVVSNGFVTFGSTSNFDWRNGRLPGASGPNAMLAPFWDNLEMHTESGIYTFYDSSNSRFIIEWYKMYNGFDSESEETFQIILNDPATFPSSTGDGTIKIQYKVFNNVDYSSSTHNHGNYATVGIKDHTGTIGLEYTYQNTYPVSALPLANHSALFITTAPIIPTAPFLWLTQTDLLDTNSNGYVEPGEALDLRLTVGNMGSVTASNVTVTISESDPYVSISGNTASYGSIDGLDSFTNSAGLYMNVQADCPNNHIATITAVINCTGYSFTRTFTITINTAVLSFGSFTVSDPSPGNNNGVLDPGETVTINLALYNTGLVASSAGSAALTSPTSGITIITGSCPFSAINASGNQNLVFNLSADSYMEMGTLAHLHFSATAGSINSTSVQYLEIGAPLALTIGYGVSTQTYPLDRYYNYSAHEAIYLASEIGSACQIKSIGYHKTSGDDLQEITGVSIYMKNTSQSTLTTDIYSLAGYTLVYSGSFPNSAASGWMEVNLDTMFEYNGINNLAIIVVKDFQQYIYDYPQWYCSNISISRARQAHSDSNAPSTLTATTQLPNVMFRYFPLSDLLYPPQSLTVLASHASVSLSWEVPILGTPDAYNIYRDDAMFASVTGLAYTDYDVVNGTTYNYCIKASYGGEESSATETVQATPNLLAPTGLIAYPDNQAVNLSWAAVTARTASASRDNGQRLLSGYKVYRNGIHVATVLGAAYQDTGLTNGLTYSYYVTTIYTDPEGESGPSNTATATPNVIDYVNIGSGTLSSQAGYASPINITYKSLHGQSVYTAAELNASGIYGPAYIIGLGFDIVSAPLYDLPDFVIRMKHTADTNVANWQTATELQTVYSSISYHPAIGGYDMLVFQTPFLWNGIENIVVDTAFDLVPEWNQSGTIRYTSVTSGYRYTWNDYSDQTNIFTGGSYNERRPNIRIGYASFSLDAPRVRIEQISGGVYLSWEEIAGATSYIVYGSSEPDTGFVEMETVESNEFYDFHNLGQYFYRVVAATDN